MEERDTNRIVASRVQRLRKERGWSAQRLADECRRFGPPYLDRNRLAKIEANLRRRISIEEVEIMARALDVTVDQLRGESELTVPPIHGESGLTILHLSDLHLGATGTDLASEAMVDALLADLDELRWSPEAVQPDLVVLTGDLALAGGRRDFEHVRRVLDRLSRTLGLGFERFAVVPGDRDVSLAKSRSYFAECEAEETEPTPPYWPKWQFFESVFTLWPDEGRGVRIEAEQPWSLFRIPDLQVVIAGINSTIDDNHLQEQRQGNIGARQARWFAESLKAYEKDGWFRIGLVHHRPEPSEALPGDSLRDAAHLEEEINPHLHLLLHGQAVTGDDLRHRPPGVLVSSAGQTATADGDAALQYTILRVTASGVRRAVRVLTATPEGWRTGRAGDALFADPVAVTWPHAQAAFPSAAERPVSVAAPGVGEGAEWSDRQPGRGDDDRLPTSREMLLDEVADVWRARNSEAQIKGFAGPPPYLRVTYREGDLVRQLRIGAAAGPFDQDTIDAFVNQVNVAGPATVEFVYQDFIPPKELRDYAALRKVRLRSFVDLQGVLGLDRYVAVQTERLAANPNYAPTAYVPQRYTDVTRGTSVEADDLLTHMIQLLDSDEGSFILLLGDFGRGKTFALRELTRIIPHRLPHLIPIFIELRALDKAHTIEGLVAAHLANHGQDRIDLNAFRYMHRHGRIVLIFDGFDELVARATYDRATDHLQKLLGAAQDQAKIVVASRSQHFRTRNQILTVMGEQLGTVPQRQILSLSDLSRAQIRQILLQRYDQDAEAADHRLNLLESIPGLGRLAQNPRMLSFIAGIEEPQLRAVVQAGGAMSAANLYHEILTFWLDYEKRRTQDIPGVPAGLNIDDLWHAVIALASRMWETGNDLISLDQLSAVAAATLDKLASAAHLSAEQVTHALGAGSLLVRTDEGMFGFIHNSVMEWLIAQRVRDDLERSTHPRDLTVLSRQLLSSLSVDFLCDLADTRLLQQWATTVLDDESAGQFARENAGRCIARLELSGKHNMRGISLVGQDLSYRSWPGVDLTGADLSGVRFVGADLSGAILRDARLTDAVLDEADLTGADLTGARLIRARMLRTVLRDAVLDGAVLSQARLIEADLTGSRATGTTWRRAAVLRSTGAEAIDAERAGAAVYPGGRPLEVAVMPHAVGVMFGFEDGRVPRPVAYDAIGSLLGIGNEDGSILLCDANTGDPLRTLIGHSERAHAVTFTPSRVDPVLATGSLDGTVRLWDTSTGASRAELTPHANWAWPLLFNEDGQLLATGDGNGVMRVWDVRSGTLRWEMPGHAAPIWTASFTGSSDLLAVGDDGHEGVSARVWDVRTGKLRYELDAEGSATYWLRFNPAGTLLVTGGSDGVLRLWDPATGRRLSRLDGHEHAVYALDFHPTGEYLVSAAADGSVRQWKFDGRGGVREHALAAHTGAVYRVTFGPLGRQFATGDSDGTVRLWDAATAEPMFDLPRSHYASVWPIMFHPTAPRMLTSSNDFTAKLWNTRNGSFLREVKGHGRRVRHVKFNHDGTLLATSGNDGVARVWETGTARCRLRLEHPPDALNAAVFSPVGSILATASNDGNVYLWDAETGAEGRHLVPATTESVSATVFTPDGTQIATANDDDKVQVLYVDTGRTVTMLAPESGRIKALAFSPDGATIAIGSDDHFLRLWDVRTGEKLHTLGRHGGRIAAIAYDTGGRLLASASGDGRARLFDAVTGTLRAQVEPGQGAVRSVAFHPDGERFATAGDGGTVDVWSVEDGRRLCRIPAHEHRIWSVSFSPDGRLAATGSEDGTARLWRVDGDRLTPAVTLLGLGEEWAAYTPAGRYKVSSDKALGFGNFWHIVGMCRFEPGELNQFLGDELHMSLGEAVL
ncbi:pentapeptide repeat-containing protein [Actinoplanes philippinensis]|uniref:WD40 domain-containing protein n=1 Tax=Actinoplanes philippinensis TaxID=35752 RepID=UPI003408036D